MAFRPSSPLSLIDGGGVESESLNPCGHGHGFPVPRDHAVIALVPSLLLRRGPSAVSGLVAAVIVRAVKRGSWQRIAHVGIEILEGPPPLAHADAPASIVGEAWFVGVEATRQHAAPDFMSARPGHAVPDHAWRRLKYLASAGCGVTGCEIVALDDGLAAASAAAQPMCFPVDPAVKADDGEAAERAARDVNAKALHLPTIAFMATLGNAEALREHGVN